MSKFISYFIWRNSIEIVRILFVCDETLLASICIMCRADDPHTQRSFEGEKREETVK